MQTALLGKSGLADMGDRLSPGEIDSFVSAALAFPSLASEDAKREVFQSGSSFILVSHPIRQERKNHIIFVSL